MTFQSQCKLLNHTNWYRKQKFGAYNPKGWWNSSLWWLLSILKIMSTKANNKFQLFTFGSQNIIEGLNGVMVFVARGKTSLPQNPLSRLLVVDVRFYKVGELSLGWCFRISTSFSWGGIRTRGVFRPIAREQIYLMDSLLSLLLQLILLPIRVVVIIRSIYPLTIYIKNL